MPRRKDTADDVLQKIVTLESEIISSFGDLGTAQRLHNEYIRDKNQDAKAAYLKYNRLLQLRGKYDTLIIQERLAQERLAAERNNVEERIEEMSPLIDALHIGNNDGDGDIQMVELQHGDNNDNNNDGDDNDVESNDSKLVF